LLLSHSNAARAIEPVCPDYWRNSTFVSEVYVRIPLVFEPPNKRRFLSLSLPKLDGGGKAHAFEINDKELKIIFCGLKPDAFSVENVLVVTVGPKQIEIPPSLLSIAHSNRGRTRRLVGTSLKPLALDWISPTEISFVPADKAKEALAVSFTSPHRQVIDIGSLRIRLLSEESRCRGVRDIPESRRIKINAQVTAALDGSRDAKTYPAEFYPAVHCGSPAELKIEVGPYKSSVPAEIQKFSIRILDVKFEPISADQWKERCSSLDERSDVRQCVGDIVGEPKFSVGSSEGVIIEADSSNIFPQTIRAWRRN
jgi:hypothetical protein